MDFPVLSKKLHKSKLLKKFTSDLTIKGGDGGSNCIICIYKNIVYKITPYFNICPNQKHRPTRDQMELKFYKMFTREFILTNITPHIVGCYHTYKTSMLPLFSNLCDEKSAYTKKKLSKVQHMLLYLRHSYKIKQVRKVADVCAIEKCPVLIPEYIKKSRNKESDLHRIIFQVIFTLAVIQDKYPTFVHNDLFIRNILARVETRYGKNDYVKYTFKGKTFELKANGIYVKINDFGRCLSNEIIDVVEKNRVNRRLNGPPNINCKKCDVFNFLHDFYDGDTLGTTSMIKLLPRHKKLIKSVFRQYIDIKTIDNINKKNRSLLNNTWSIYNLPFLQKTVKEPAQYLKTHKRNIVGGSELAKYNVVATFGY